LPTATLYSIGTVSFLHAQIKATIHPTRVHPNRKLIKKTGTRFAFFLNIAIKMGMKYNDKINTTTKISERPKYPMFNLIRG
jgi:hypothetical protein